MGSRVRKLRKRMAAIFMAVLLCLTCIMEWPGFGTTAQAADGVIIYNVSISGGVSGLAGSTPYGPSSSHISYSTSPEYPNGDLYIQLNIPSDEIYNYSEVTVKYSWGKGKTAKSYSFTTQVTDDYISPINAFL